MAFLKYWLADFYAHFERLYDIVIYEIDSYIPNVAPKDIEVGEHTTLLCDPEGNRVIELRRKGEHLSRVDTRVVFARYGEIVPNANVKYVYLAHQSFSKKINLLQDVQNSRLVFTSPGSGSLNFNDNAPSLLIGVPIHLRFELTKVFCEYMFTYLVPALMWKGFDTKVVLCGEVDDLKNLEHLQSNERAALSYTPNNLGDKKNAMMEYAKQTQVDYLVWIDSDDFFHPDTITTLIDVAKFNGYWASVKPFCFFNAENTTFNLFEGYPDGHTLGGWGMGSGRVFTHKLLHNIDCVFQQGNKGMDASVKSALGNLKIPVEHRLVCEPSQLPIGVKTAQNIWASSTYRTTPVEDPEWLPYEITQSIKNLAFDNS